MSFDLLTSEDMEFFRAKYGVADYQFEALNGLLEAQDVRGQTVLEVGGSNLPRELVIGRLGAESWHCIDMIPQYHYARIQQAPHYAIERVKTLAEFQPIQLLERYNIFDGMIEHAQNMPSGYFDLVFSIASFEHIQDLSGALRSIKRLLKPGGTLFSDFGPIWSCRVGHHIWIDDDLNFTVEDSTPPFVHLLHSRDDVAAYLTEKFDADRAIRAVELMFDSSRVNRLFYEDYEDLIRRAQFLDVTIAPGWIQPLPFELQARLETLHPGRKRFDAYSMKILCRA